MTTTAAAPEKSSGFPEKLYKKPYLGLMAVGTLLSWQAFGHAFTKLQWVFFDPHYKDFRDIGLPDALFSINIIFTMNMLIGLAGLLCVWRGFDKDELTATCYGAVGGALIWFGFFEYSFSHILPDILSGI